MENLHVSSVQFDISWENPDQNLTYLSQFISTIEKTNVIVLPEMFSTGFSMTPQLFENHHQENIISWMQNIAHTKQCAVCGSIIFKEKDTYYNRFLWIDETGQKIYYNKTHLFSLAGEEKVYQKDTTVAPIIHYKEWKIYPQICYDLRFPESSRNIQTKNYDLLIYVANWPERRSYAWNTLLKARAIENLSYVIATNRVGNDINQVNHSGDSQILNFEGNILKLAEKNTIQIVQTLLSKTKLIQFREKFSFLEDQI
ncbi:hydrolase MtnU [Flavobacteriaceae bacterium UJ101]|nr:hydrolase MtnU [Flavobacteriaceae bacterium UJ101]